MTTGGRDLRRPVMDQLRFRLFLNSASLDVGTEPGRLVTDKGRRRWVRDDNGSAGHGSSGSTHLSGSRGSRVSTRDPLTHGHIENSTEYLSKAF